MDLDPWGGWCYFYSNTKLARNIFWGILFGSQTSWDTSDLTFHSDSVIAESESQETLRLTFLDCTTHPNSSGRAHHRKTPVKLLIPCMLNMKWWGVPTEVQFTGAAIQPYLLMPRQIGSLQACTQVKRYKKRCMPMLVSEAQFPTLAMFTVSFRLQ